MRPVCRHDHGHELFSHHRQLLCTYNPNSPAPHEYTSSTTDHSTDPRRHTHCALQLHFYYYRLTNSKQNKLNHDCSTGSGPCSTYLAPVHIGFWRPSNYLMEVLRMILKNFTKLKKKTIRTNAKYIIS